MSSLNNYICPNVTITVKEYINGVLIFSLVPDLPATAHLGSSFSVNMLFINNYRGLRTNKLITKYIFDSLYCKVSYVSRSTSVCLVALVELA